MDYKTNSVNNNPPSLTFSSTASADGSTGNNTTQFVRNPSGNNFKAIHDVVRAGGQGYSLILSAGKYGTFSQPFANTGDLTIATWIKTTSTANTAITTLGSVTAGWGGLWLNNGRLSMFAANGLQQNISGISKTFNDGNWHFVMVTCPAVTSTVGQIATVYYDSGSGSGTTLATSSSGVGWGGNGNTHYG